MSMAIESDWIRGELGEHMPANRKPQHGKPKSIAQQGARPQCGLCGATSGLTRTDCCGQWICDDEDQYVLFSYARNSCYRNHSRYTLCGFHYNEEHPGKWQDCVECRESFETADRSLARGLSHFLAS